ncbi:thialysine N-epsilon-acetyltransferase-like [Haliotis cracherodii]|uniref:thialysine N-epsilon-acetyltransferase-like n=1 Tax=Haliotis cracherodii TaxID=6455 RepID=UPI0039EAF902
MSRVSIMADYIIRDARLEDCGEIFLMLKELQEHLKDMDHMTLEEESLKNDGFGEDKFFQCIVAEQKPSGDVKPALVGYLLYCWSYSTSAGRMMVVQDFYVRQTYRTQGTGSALWAHATKVALEKGCREVEWIVHDWNVQAIKFYKKLGAVDMSKGEGWLVYRLDVNAMRSVVATDTVNKQ